MKRFYSLDIEYQMRHFFEGLPERKRREYAVIEANKLGHGGSIYISGLLGIDRKTIYHGRKSQADFDEVLPQGRQRRVGGGRKKNV